MSTKLFVGNLAFSATEIELQDTFSPYGTVESVDLIQDRMTGKSRGFAFVTMGSPEEAEAAIEGVNGRSVGGRNLTVNVARPREERPRGGGGGGGGYGGGGGGGGRRDFRGGGGGGGGGERRERRY